MDTTRRQAPSNMKKKKLMANSGSSSSTLTVQKFAHNAGHTHALLGFRERRERKRVQTARALREYRKAMKREGYEPGMGASRKRFGKQAEEDEEDQTNEKEDYRKEMNAGVNGLDNLTAATKSNDGHHTAQVDEKANDLVVEVEKHRRQRKPRTHIFKKSEQRAMEKRKEIEERRVQRKENDKERNQKLRKRRQRTKLLTARTRKGQPVMNNIVQDILHRLEKDQQSGK